LPRASPWPWQYGWAAVDASQNALDGAKNYKLHLPPSVLVSDF
jgi:hypothetical protein